jgi:hypothetical protein
MLHVRANSHTRLRAHDYCTSSTLIGGKGGAGPSLLHTMLRDRQNMWMQNGCKVYMDSYMASNKSCFMVTWIIFKNQCLEVGQTQNRETMALRTLTTVDLFYFIMCEEPTQIEIYWNSNCLRARSHMASHYTSRPVTTLHGFGSALGRLVDNFLWALTISWSRILSRVWHGRMILTIQAPP